MTDPTTRRDFLRYSAAAGLGLPLLGAGGLSPAGPAAVPAAPRPRPAGRKLKILFLGGTGFLGPATVEEALVHGHAVTLFNRGKTNAHLFPEAEKLRGDRNKGELDALAGRARWDAVIDTSGYVPGHVAATAGMLADRVDHYIFVSSVSVYPRFGESPEPVDETTPVATVGPEVVARVKTIRESLAHYGAMKALCEKAADKAMPGRTTVVRPGLIVGPGDKSDRFTYWVTRVDRGGEVLSPGEPEGIVQFVDVRDLGAWILHCVEDRVLGVFNAVGLRGRLSFQEFLHGCKCVTTTPCRFTWVDQDFLKKHEIKPWTHLPMWLPREGRTPIVNKAAMAQGLEFRPAADTLADTLQWARFERGAKPYRAGLPAAREKEVLAAYRSRPGK